MRHRWREVQAGELVQYGSTWSPRRCERCGIFRFTSPQGRESVTHYARMTTNGRPSQVLQRWNHAPPCPPEEPR